MRCTQGFKSTLTEIVGARILSRDRAPVTLVKDRVFGTVPGRIRAWCDA